MSLSEPFGFRLGLPCPDYRVLSVCVLTEAELLFLLIIKIMLTVPDGMSFLFGFSASVCNYVTYYISTKITLMNAPAVSFTIVNPTACLVRLLMMMMISSIV